MVEIAPSHLRGFLVVRVITIKRPRKMFKVLDNQQRKTIKRFLVKSIGHIKNQKKPCIVDGVLKYQAVVDGKNLCCPIGVHLSEKDAKFLQDNDFKANNMPIDIIDTLLPRVQEEEARVFLDLIQKAHDYPALYKKSDFLNCFLVFANAIKILL